MITIINKAKCSNVKDGWKDVPLDFHLYTVCMVYYFLYVPKWPREKSKKRFSFLR